MLRTRHFRSPARIALIPFLLSVLTSCSAGDGTTAPGDAWSVDFSSSLLTFTSMNSGQSVTATVRDNKGVSIPDASVSWQSENPLIAEVSGGGRTVSIVAKSPGSTNIRATSGSAEATLIVTVMGVHAVQLNKANVSLRIGETQSLSAQVNADPGVSGAVTWSSANASVATVNDQGVITAIGPGATTVTATSVADVRFKGTAQIAVAPLRGIVVAPSAVTLTSGQSQAFSATVSLSGQSTAVAWRSNNAAIASVNAQGVVTAVSVGTATITVESVADPTLQTSAQVTVAPVVHSVDVSPSAAQLSRGDVQQLVATVTADAGLSQNVTWRSSNAAIASVSNTGMVSAVALGTVTVTALSAVDTTKRASASITVTARPVNVQIVQRNVSIIPGTTSQLTATVTADQGVSTALSWTSRSTGVATVSSSGLVTGVSGGTATIVATSLADASRKDSVSVSVAPRLASSWSASHLNGALYEEVLSLYVAASDNVFAVNLMGDIYRYNGTTWSRVLTGSTSGTSFRAVHGTSASNVFAVGTNGKIFRWQGSTWTQMTSGTTATLNAVYAASPTAVYAVGDNGAAVRYTGTAWLTTTTGSTRNLTGVWGQGTMALAVGDAGEVVRYNGSVWTHEDTPTSENLHAVSGLDAANAFAVGDFGTLLRYDGSDWSTMPSGVTADLNGVAVSPTDARIYVAGSFGTALVVQGSFLTDLSSPYATRFNTAVVDASGNLWTAGQRGVVQRRSGSTWTVLNIAPDLIDVWSTSATNAVAVGEFGFIYQWNGINWTRQDSPTRVRLNTVWASGTDDAFAGGDGGVMLRWNGSIWTTMSLPSSNDVLALWGTSSTNVYAVTFGGEVLRYSGTSWSVVTTQSNALYGIYGSGPNDVYATGDAGTVLRFDGNSWTPRNVNAAALLVGVWSSGPTNLLTVGLSPANPLVGAAYQYNGSSWSASNLAITPPELTSVWGANPFDLYATGGAGTILRYNGLSWQSMSAGTTDYLWSVTGAPNGQGGAFAVGYNTTLVVGSGAAGSVASFVSTASTRPVAVTFDPSPRSRRAAAAVVPEGVVRRSVRSMHTRR